MCKTKIKKRIIYSVLIYKGTIIATTVTITTMTPKESDDKSQIRNMRANKFCSYIYEF